MSPLSLTRISFFLIVMAVWYFSILSIAIPLTLWYLYSFRAYELIIIGALLDGYFLLTVDWPLYTIVFAVAVGVMEVVKPRLRSKKIYEI